VTDAGVNQLSACESLEELVVNHRAVTDIGLAAVGKSKGTPRPRKRRCA
jgi:hypothetical protein